MHLLNPMGSPFAPGLALTHQLALVEPPSSCP